MEASRERGKSAVLVQGLTVRQDSGTPYLILRTREGILLEVEIGAAEASALILHHQGVDPKLPLTHELLERALEAGAVRVRLLEIFEWDEEGPRCRLHLEKEGVVIPPWLIRPSDGFILALRMNFPVMMDVNLAHTPAAVGRALWNGREEIFSLVPPPGPTVH